MKIIKRNYYWSFMWKTINWYIWNCYICQWLKISKDKSNDLLHSLSISDQRWCNIIINFVIDLSSSNDNNTILTVICRLSKERHYISYFTDDEEIAAKKTVELLLQWIYQIHDLSNFIVFDWDSQFTFILWKSFCKWLSIFLQLFIIYHLQINDQSEQVNQNIKRYLCFFCSYMQNDWFKWLSMIEFIDNNALFSVINMTLFFMNKSFHSHMNFNSDIIEYENIHERLQTAWIKNIFNHMNKTLTFACKALIKSWK